MIHALWLGTLNEFKYPTTSTQGHLTFVSLEVVHGPVVCSFPKLLALLKKVSDLAVPHLRCLRESVDQFAVTGFG